MRLLHGVQPTTGTDVLRSICIRVMDGYFSISRDNDTLINPEYTDWR